MPYIPYVEYDELSDTGKRYYDEQLIKNGRITNMKKTLLHSVKAFEVYQEWYPLKNEIVEFIGEKGVIIFSHAISTGNQCLLCSAYFRKELLELGLNPDALELSEDQELLITFGNYISNTSKVIPNQFYEQLGRHFTKQQIVKLTAFGGIMAATNIFNSVLQVELDDNLSGYDKK